MAEFAGGEPVLNARLALNISDATGSIDEVAKYAENTFANLGKGGGGGEAMRQRGIRAAESSLDRETSRYAIGGAVGSEQNPARQYARATQAGASGESEAFQSWVTRHELHQDTYQNREDAAWMRQQQRDADNYRKNYAAQQAAVTREQDRNETRYSKSKDAADFAEFSANQKRFERDRDSGGYSRGQDDFFSHPSMPDDDYIPDRDDEDHRLSRRSRNPRHAERIRRNRELSDARDLPDEQFGPGGGSSRAENVREARRRTPRRVAREWNQGGNVPFDDFDEENFGSNLDEGIADAESKLPEAYKGPGFFGKNFPTFSKLFGKSGQGGLGVFYKRFLAMEALRSVSQFTQVASEHTAGLLRAGGNPLATAQFNLQEGKELADAIPFVGGLFYGALNAGTGASTAVASAELGEKNVAGLESRRQLAIQRADVRGQTAVATSPRGYSRTISGIDEDQRKSLVESKQRETDEGKLITDSTDRKKVEIEANRPILAGRFGYGEADFRTDEALASVDRSASDDRARAADHHRQEDADINSRYQRQRDETTKDMTIATLGADKAGNLYQRQSQSLLRPSGTQFFDPVFQGMQKQQDIRFEEQRKEGDEDQYLATFNASNEGDAAKPRRQSERNRVMGERHLREAGNKVQSDTVQAETDRNIGLEFVNNQERYGSASAAINRDPRAAIDNAYTAQVNRNRYLSLPQRVFGDVVAGRQKQAANQEQDDRMFLEKSSLDLKEQVTGLEAKAYGPGGNTIRRQAQLTSIGGGAELQAQSILRDPGIDANKKVGFADTARRTGINELEGYGARYAAGFRSVETNRFNIAPGNMDSANPSAVFHSIDDAEKKLKDKMGTGATNGNSGSAIPGLIQQIITILQGGGTALFGTAQ